jgi:hypothetical protein
LSRFFGVAKSAPKDGDTACRLCSFRNVATTF